MMFDGTTCATRSSRRRANLGEHFHLLFTIGADVGGRKSDINESTYLCRSVVSWSHHERVNLNGPLWFDRLTTNGENRTDHKIFRYLQETTTVGDIVVKHHRLGVGLVRQPVHT